MTNDNNAPYLMKSLKHIYNFKELDPGSACETAVRDDGVPNYDTASKAGGQFLNFPSEKTETLKKVYSLDSRLRGNDGKRGRRVAEEKTFA